jgi:hypothetical protein
MALLSVALLGNYQSPNPGSSPRHFHFGQFRAQLSTQTYSCWMSLDQLPMTGMGKPDTGRRSTLMIVAARAVGVDSGSESSLLKEDLFYKPVCLCYTNGSK